jgi:hypothetical protein
MATEAELWIEAPTTAWRERALKLADRVRRAEVGECQGSCRLNYVMIPPIDEAAALAG